MILEKLLLTNFRNHSQLEINFPDPSVSFYISGANGAGKTSIVEAIYLLYTLRTFRSQPLNDIKSFDADFMRIQGEFRDETIENAVFFYQQDKKILINGSDDFISHADYSYTTPVICYSPSFETLLSGEHSERRAFLDRMVFYQDKSHMELIRNYNSLLKRKRALLDEDIPDAALVEIINEKLSPLSEKISEARLALVENINAAVRSREKMADKLMPGIELTLSVNSMQGRDFSTELAGKKPLYGAHKDLLYVKRDGKIIEKFQSFGQKKSCLLFLLCNLAAHISDTRGGDILMLFDDFEAGLDEERISVLSGFIAESRADKQVLLTGISNRHHPSAETMRL